MSKRPIRIAFTGKMRSGKSTAANRLRFEHGFDLISFATPIHRIADDYFSHMYEPIYEEAFVDCPFGGSIKRKVGTRKPRKVLQQVGQLLREIDDEVWIRQAQRMVEYSERFRDCKGVVIDDLRQDNEAKWAKDNGFIIIRVNADESDRLARIERAGDDFKAEDLRHETEQYVDDIQADYDIWNGEGVSEDELRRRVDEILAEIKASN